MNTTFNGIIADYHMHSGVAYIYGTVKDFHMHGGTVYNSGTIDDMHHHGGVIYHSNGKAPEQKIVYKDRIVEKEVIKEVIKEVPCESKEADYLRERLSAVIEVNHLQAERIKELERIIEEHREAEMPSPWDIEPTPKECEKLLKQLDIYTTYDY